MLTKNIRLLSTGALTLGALALASSFFACSGDDDDTALTPTPSSEAGPKADTGSPVINEGGAQPDTGSIVASTKHLYVWAGPRAGAPHMKTSNDVVVVLDIDKASPTYKKAVQVVDVGSSNNEPHHGEICNNRLIVGGLYSGKLITLPVDPATGKLGAPTTLTAVGTNVGGADEVVCSGDKVFVSWLSNSMGAAPGGIVEYNGADMSVVATYPGADDSPAETGTVNGFDLAEYTGTNTKAKFNPHGLIIDVAADVMITTDAVIPNTTGGMGPPTFQNTVRIWKFSTRKIIQTIPLCAGVGAAQFVPNSNGTRAVAACNLQLWSLDKDAVSGKWSSSLLSSPPGATSPLGATLGTMTSLLTGTTLFVAQPDPGRILKIDATMSGSAASISGMVTTGPGAHFIHRSKDGSQIFGSDYVNQTLEVPMFGMPPSDGRVWIINTGDMTADGAPIEFHASTDPLLMPLGDLNPHAVIPLEK